MPVLRNLRLSRPLANNYCIEKASFYVMRKGIRLAYIMDVAINRPRYAS